LFSTKRRNDSSECWNAPWIMLVSSSGAGRIEWFEGPAQGDGSGVRFGAGGHGEGSAGAAYRQWDAEMFEPEAALLGGFVADLFVDLLPVGHLADSHVAVHSGGEHAGQPVPGGGHVGQHGPDVVGAALMSMVVVMVGMCGFLPRMGWGF